MADQTPDQTKIKTFIASALGFWRWLVGLFPAFSVWVKTLWANPWFDKPLPKIPAFRMSKEFWEEMKDVATGLPCLLIQMAVWGGEGLNILRMLIEMNTEPRVSADGAMRYLVELPQIQEFHWLAALVLLLTLGRGLAREIAKAAIAIQALKAGV